jgi:hypothetical protein
VEFEQVRIMKFGGNPSRCEAQKKENPAGPGFVT